MRVERGGRSGEMMDNRGSVRVRGPLCASATLDSALPFSRLLDMAAVKPPPYLFFHPKQNLHLTLPLTVELLVTM